MGPDIGSADSGNNLPDDIAFQLKNGTGLSSDYDSGTYTITGIAYDEINNIQMKHNSAYNGDFSVTVKTVEIINYFLDE